MFIPPESWGFVYPALLHSSQDWPSRGNTERGTKPALRTTRLELDGRAPLPCWLRALHAAAVTARRPLSHASSLNWVSARARSVPVDVHAQVSVPCGLSGEDQRRETVNPWPVGCYFDFPSSPPGNWLLWVFKRPWRATACTCPGAELQSLGETVGSAHGASAGPGAHSRPLPACVSNTPLG